MLKVVAALIIVRNKILIAQRAKGHLKGKWEFPGGKIETNETPQDAIVRELKEELNLVVEPIREIHSFDYTYPFGEINLNLIMCRIIKTPEIIFDGSHTAFKWYDLTNEGPEFAPLDKIVLEYIKDKNVI